MRCTASMLAAWLLAMATSTAAAGPDPEPNRIGIYFDAAANTQEVLVGIIGVVKMHIIITNPTFTTVHGWQAAIRGIDPAVVVIAGATIAEGDTIQGPHLQFDVVCDHPLVAQPVTVLATIVGVTFRDFPTCLTLTGIDEPAIPELLPLVWTQPDQPTPMQVSHLYVNGVAASINDYRPIPEMTGCAGTVATESRTWGSIKALYR